MGKLYNNRILDGISKITDVFIIGLYFIICSIPVFTMGASLTALYYAIHKSVFRGRGYTTEFFHSFKENFKQSTLSWIIFMVIFAVLAGDIYVTRFAVPQTSAFAAAPLFFLIMLCFAILWAIYHFAYIARFANGFGASFKVSAIIMVANLGWSFLILVVLAAFILLTFRFIILLFFLPGLITASIHPIIERVFRKYMTPEDLESELE
ncbi:YesL family protein [Pseudobutyrivibrio sp.]|uniref:YesL family protein n=1 Tax=Pseudobutyrivibrio sp. TaxID=2014367 RepID=UPI001DA427A7|nr:YesL family protein [Pseudobutyrivibrio sp.]MBE5910626.1 DUF624 domain-containing protein [Pseudobutyrivibrio sp.]